MNILLIDDHPIYRQGLTAVLQHFGDAVRIAEATTVGAAMDILRERRGFDLILLDWCLPDGGGMKGLLAIVQLLPQVPLVVVSANESEEVITQALAAGARGYIPKSAGSSLIISALTLVLSGEVYVPAIVVDGYLKRPADAASLTDRQGQVLQLLGRGNSNKQIARALDIAETTVRVHVSDILRNLNANNRTEAVIKARHLGLLD